MNFVLIWSLGYLVSTLKSLQIENRIAQGYAAPVVQPWMASLQQLNGFNFCGGALISPNTVLTAGHCLRNMNPAQIYVQLGALNLDQANRNERIQGLAIRMEPNFYFGSVNNGYSRTYIRSDIGLLKLAQPSNNTVLQLDDRNIGGTVNANVRAIGYGDLGNGYRNYSPRPLREVQLRIGYPSECQRYYPSTFDANQSLCVTNYRENVGAGTCSGDSGSPLVLNDRAIGVVSYGSGSCNTGVSVYTRVYSFLNFIYQNLN